MIVAVHLALDPVFTISPAGLPQSIPTMIKVGDAKRKLQLWSSICGHHSLCCGASQKLFTNFRRFLWRTSAVRWRPDDARLRGWMHQPYSPCPAPCPCSSPKCVSEDRGKVPGLARGPRPVTRRNKKPKYGRRPGAPLPTASLVIGLSNAGHCR